MNLKDDDQLERSGIVANRHMNRQRRLRGCNSYEEEFGFNIVDHLLEAVDRRGQARWLDLCCGEAKALSEAAVLLKQKGVLEDIHLCGVDLVSDFSEEALQCEALKLVQSSLHTWQSETHFDLITCVHGLHYIGDKLSLIERATNWLAPGGLFTANLDHRHISIKGFTSRKVLSLLRSAGLEFCRRRRIIRAHSAIPSFPLRYLGGDDQVGPNYTGRDAVASIYQPIQ